MGMGRLGTGRLAVKHRSVLMADEGSLGQCNEKSVEMQFILQGTKRWFWLRRKHLCVCIREQSQPRVTPGLEQDGPCRACSRGSGESPAQHCASGLGNPSSAFHPPHACSCETDFCLLCPHHRVRGQHRVLGKVRKLVRVFHAV